MKFSVALASAATGVILGVGAGYLTTPEVKPMPTSDFIAVAIPRDNLRSMLGQICACDGNTITVLTEDGNLWTVENYANNPSNAVLVTFDTRGTSDTRDDRITQITTTSTFAE